MRSGAKIKLMNELPLTQNKEKIIRVSGLPENVRNGKELLMIVAGAQDHTFIPTISTQHVERFYIGAGLIGKVIGQGGKTRMDLEAEYHVIIAIAQLNLGEREKLITIIGSLQSASECKARILNMISLAKDRGPRDRDDRGPKRTAGRSRSPDHRVSSQQRQRDRSRSPSRDKFARNKNGRRSEVAGRYSRSGSRDNDRNDRPRSRDRQRSKERDIHRSRSTNRDTQRSKSKNARKSSLLLTVTNEFVVLLIRLG
jgi:hypothetical protein